MKINAVNNFTVAPRIQKVKKQEQVQARLNNYVAAPLNLHKNQILFGRSEKEHNSWGATINKDGTINFKIPSYPDAKKVYVYVAKNENVVDIDKVYESEFYVDRDDDNHVTSIKPINKNFQIFELDNKGNGIFEKSNIEGLKAGQPYHYIIVDKYDDTLEVKDPYSKEQRQVMSWSIIHNENNYNWNDTRWMSGRDKRRISRQENSGLKNVGALRIYEMNIPTITQEGDFLSAKKALAEIADKNLANTVEIMPVENCFSKQWGYDGVDKFAINERLGKSEDLKEFIDYAHSLGLNVIMDMVPNHIGTDGDTLRKTGPFERGDGAFGAMFNYEGRNNVTTRDWMSNIALHWAKEYHVDGIRFDMTKPEFMGSDFTLKQITTELNEHFPDVFTIAEDGMGNRPEVIAKRDSTGSHKGDLEKLDNDIASVTNGWGLPRVGGFGFDSEWDFTFLHELEKAVRKDYDFNIYNFDAALRNSEMRVSYPISHDEQGNLDGTSFITKRATEKLDLYHHMKGTTPQEIGQKTAHATQYLLELYATGKMDKMDNTEWAKVVEGLDIRRPVSKDEIRRAYYDAIKRAKLAIGTVYSIPGPKMFFQGMERASLDYFKFFRDFSTEENQKDTKIEKGYRTHTREALADSLPNRIKYSPEIRRTMGKVELFTKEMGEFVDENPALQNGRILNTIVHDKSSVHASHSKKGDNEIFAVKNFSDVAYSEYGIAFPPGKWVEYINSNDKRYGSSGNYINYGNDIYGDGYNNQNIKIGSNSVAIFKKVG